MKTDVSKPVGGGCRLFRPLPALISTGLWFLVPIGLMACLLYAAAPGRSEPSDAAGIRVQPVAARPAAVWQRQKPIEEVELGDRVQADNPEGRETPIFQHGVAADAVEISLLVVQGTEDEPELAWVRLLRPGSWAEGLTPGDKGRYTDGVISAGSDALAVFGTVAKVAKAGGAAVKAAKAGFAAGGGVVLVASSMDATTKAIQGDLAGAGLAALSSLEGLFVVKLVSKAAGSVSAVADAARTTRAITGEAAAGVRKAAGAAGERVAATASRVGSYLDDFCFDPSTPVATPTGSRPMAEVSVGDEVLAMDFGTGQWLPSRVSAVSRSNYTGGWVELGFADGSGLSCTAGHPFWVAMGEGLNSRAAPDDFGINEDVGRAALGRWVNAHDVAVGDRLLDRHGRPVEVSERVVSEAVDRPVANLTVEERPSYAAGLAEVLAHNGSGWCDLYKKHLDGPPPDVDALRRLDNLTTIAANLSTETKTYRVHGHHIVMKGKWFADRHLIQPSTRQAQALLQKYDIPMLGTKQELRDASDLSNMANAINGVDGIHSKRYQDAVRHRLVAAEKRGADFATRKAQIKSELQKIRIELEENVPFWNGAS